MTLSNKAEFDLTQCYLLTAPEQPSQDGVGFQDTVPFNKKPRQDDQKPIPVITLMLISLN